MTLHRNEMHEKTVDEWEKRNATNVSVEQLPQLYAKAIQAIHQRSQATLSNVTLWVVIDRALFEAKEKYPSLLEIKFSSESIDFRDFLDKPALSKAEMKNALRIFLIEILNVLGNITADVLTIPLHDELMSVTNERTLTFPPQQTLHAVSATKKNREQK